MRLSDVELLARLAQAEAVVPPLRWYRHRRTGLECYAGEIALREGDLEPCVVYHHPATGDPLTGRPLTFVRPLAEFAERFEPA